MDFGLIYRIYPFFLEASLVTIQISIYSTLLGLFCGALGTSAKLSRYRVFRYLGNAYVSLIRGTPCLIQLFILYFGGSQVGIQLEAFEAGIIGLGVNIGAYMTESMRGAIIAVDKGQVEAARTLGMSRFQCTMKVILPQAARLMIRPLGVNINALIKGTALVATISVVELTYTAQRYIGSTYKPLEMFVLSGTLYLIIIYVTRIVTRWLDNRFVIP